MCQIGEHINQVAGEAVWKPHTKGSVNIGLGLAEPGEKLAVAAATHNPLLAVVISHLHRAMLTGEGGGSRGMGGAMLPVCMCLFGSGCCFVMCLYVSLTWLY